METYYEKVTSIQNTIEQKARTIMLNDKIVEERSNFETKLIVNYDISKFDPKDHTEMLKRDKNQLLSFYKAIDGWRKDFKLEQTKASQFASIVAYFDKLRHYWNDVREHYLERVAKHKEALKTCKDE